MAALLMIHFPSTPMLNDLKTEELAGEIVRACGCGQGVVDNHEFAKAV